jgi:hypothetical protein
MIEFLHNNEMYDERFETLKIEENIAKMKKGNWFVQNEIPTD